MKVNDELKLKTIVELDAECDVLAKQLFVLRMQRGFQSKQKTHLFKKLKKSIAQIKTVMTEKERLSS